MRRQHLSLIAVGLLILSCAFTVMGMLKECDKAVSAEPESGRRGSGFPNGQTQADPAHSRTVMNTVMADPEVAVETAMTGDRTLPNQQSLTATPLGKGPWSVPLQRLIEKGKQGSDVAAELTALLECQPGIGDQLMQLLVEGKGTLLEKRALLVALGTALSMNPSPPEIWIDRRGVLEWVVELWIEGIEEFGEMDRWLWSVEGIDGHLAFDLIDQFLSRPADYPDGSGKRVRWRRVVTEGLQSEIDHEAPPWLKQWALDWLAGDDPEFRRIAVGILGKLYSTDETELRRKLLSVIRTRDVPVQLEAGKEILTQTEGPQLTRVLDEWADFFIRHEYRGSELWAAFHQAREEPLKPVLYRRGESAESESYRLWILYGSIGGRDRSGHYPREWLHTFEEAARLDQAQVVRYMALRLCALGWGERTTGEFLELARHSGVNPEQLNRAVALLGRSGKKP